MLSRRRFLKVGATLAAAGGALPFAPQAAAWADATPPLGKASQLVAGKHDSLLVHTADPLVFETPLERLDGERITSKANLFVRNNSNPDGAATTAPPAAGDWKIELVGLAGGAKSIDLAALEKLPRTEVEMVLQCSGNGRAMFSRAAKTSGTQWGRGAVGNVVFSGVKLADALKQVGAEPPKSAKYLTAEGKDSPRPKEDDFEHSVPLDDALASAFLALSMNGEPLPAVHGGPVRLVLPGYYGTVQMKWLSKLRFEEEESANSHHAVRYRTPRRRLAPGEKYTFDRSNSVPTWKIKIASLCTSHRDGQEVSAGKVRLSGWAWNDGAAPITEVRASTDLGETWKRIAVEVPKSPFSWTRWNFDFDAARGAATVWFAAVDELGRTQPLNGLVAWNPAGYEWNAVEKISLVVK